MPRQLDRFDYAPGEADGRSPDKTVRGILVTDRHRSVIRDACGELRDILADDHVSEWVATRLRRILIQLKDLKLR
jgi:hypothetical protein